MKKDYKKENRFIVKESKAMNIVLSLVFWIMFFSAINYNEFKEINPAYINRFFYITIIPAIYFLLQSFKNTIIIDINPNGFYYMGSLVTTWENFVTAKYTQEEKLASISDNFVMFIEYFKPNADKSFIMKIRLGKTQNKSEEEIIEAIEYFHQQSHQY